MTNTVSSFPAAPAIAPLHRHGGKMTAMFELPVHALGTDYFVEGNGTVQRLPALAAGTTVFLEIIGTPTFINSPGLICQGAANYAAGAGDLVIARSDGSGIWRLYPLPAAGRVNSLNGQTGNPVSYCQPQGRLTLTSGFPVVTSSVTAATAVLYTPAGMDLCPIYDGTNMIPTIFAEYSQATTDTTKSPAAVTTNSNYDIFGWNDSGTIRFTRGPAWSSNTSRGTGAGSSELVRVKGLLLNANAITNGPAAQRGTYVGSIRSNGTSTIDYLVGGSGSGGVAGSMCVWNMYNRVFSTMNSVDTGAGYTLTSGLRQARASAGNQCSFLVGLIEDAFEATYQNRIDTSATATLFGAIGIGLDSTSSQTGPLAYVQAPTAAVSFGVPIVSLIQYPPLGFHTLAALEAGGSTITFNNSSIGTLSVSLWN